MRTPAVPGRAANSSYTRRERSDQSVTRSTGSIRYGHHSAPATADVVRGVGSRVQTRTRRPKPTSSRAVVRPMTPPPTTITSLLASLSTNGP